MAREALLGGAEEEQVGNKQKESQPEDALFGITNEYTIDSLCVGGSREHNHRRRIRVRVGRTGR